jgi:diguanylate cyclase
MAGPQVEPSAVEQAAFKLASEGLRVAITEVAAIIDQTQSEARGYGAQLSGATKELGPVGENDAAKQVIARLLVKTNSFLDKTAEVETRLAAASAQISQLNAELEAVRREAATDQLTGLGNRRQFDERLGEAMVQAKESGHPISLIIFDLDHFKKFNDAKGHLVGDQVLRHVGRQTARAVRDGDTAARYGGEEFALLLPGAKLETARAIAERLRVTFDMNPLIRRDTREEIGHVTISAGVALYRVDESAEDFVGRADRALYAAKHKGRNRVVTEVLLGPVAPVS